MREGRAEKPWKRENLPNGEIHVYPTFGPKHQLDGLKCWCHPEASNGCDRIILHEVAH